MKYRLVDSGKQTALDNMREDSVLLQTIKSHDDPLIRFYEFSSLSLTHGYFMDPVPFLHPLAKEKHHLQIAKRPTGGGILFHGFDLTFSLLIPAKHPHCIDNVKESYRFINQKVIEAIKSAFGIDTVHAEAYHDSPIEGFCMAKPTVFDVMLGSKKVGGSAQRRTKAGLLHQSSLNLQSIERSLLEELLLDKSIIDGILSGSRSLLKVKNFLDVRKNFKETLFNILIQN